MVLSVRATLSAAGVSAFAFRLLQEGVTEDDLAARLMAEYDVSEETVRRDMASFLSALKEADALV